MAAGPLPVRPQLRKPGAKTRRTRLITAGLLILPLLLLLAGASRWLFVVYFGVTVGFILQRSRFCLSSAVRDLTLFGQGELARAAVVMLFLSVPGFAWLQAATGRGAALGNVAPVGLLTGLGGFLFGLGMVLAGGCISGALWRLGEGHLGHLWTLLGIALGSLAGFFWGQAGWFRPRQALYLPALLGQPLALATELGLLAAAWWWLWRLDAASAREDDVDDTPPSGTPASSAIRSLLVRVTRPWPAWLAALLMALLSVGFIALRGRPWGVVAPFLRWPELLGLTAPEPHTAVAQLVVITGVLLNAGISLGAAVSALQLREFRWRLPRSPRQAALALFGGLMMGLGATLGGGCTWGAMAAGISSQSLHGWVFALFLFPGAWVGGRWLRRALR